MTVFCVEPGCTWKTYRDTPHCWNHRGLATQPGKCPAPGDNGQPCGRDVRSVGLCPVHRRQQTRTGELKPIGSYKQVCRFEGCVGKHWAHGLCRGHASQFQRGTELAPLGARRNRGRAICDGPGNNGGLCGRVANRGGKCESHRKQLDRGNQLTPVLEHKVTATCDGPGVDGKPCGRKATRTGMCDRHNQQQAAGDGLYPIGQKAGAKCAECGGKPYAKGLCKPHYQRQYDDANPRTRKTTPKTERPKPAPTLAPLPPWNPNALKHADTRPPRPVGGGSGPRSVARVEELPPEIMWDAWRALCHHADRDQLADLAGALGITPEAFTRDEVAA